MANKLDQLQARIGYNFADIGLVSLALNHKSCASEGLPTNERLELLGDKVMGVIITQAFFEKNETFNGGKISAMSRPLLSNECMHRHAQAIRLGEHLQFGRDFRPENLGAHTMAWILADAFEALIAALYLDAGFNPTRAFVLRMYARDLNRRHF